MCWHSSRQLGLHKAAFFFLFHRFWPSFVPLYRNCPYYPGNKSSEIEPELIWRKHKKGLCCYLPSSAWLWPVRIHWEYSASFLRATVAQQRSKQTQNFLIFPSFMPVNNKKLLVWFSGMQG